jgi:hypothetical protein
MLLHPPAIALCSSVKKKGRFPCEWNEIVGPRVGEGGGVHWCWTTLVTHQSVVCLFVWFFALMIFPDVFAISEKIGKIGGNIIRWTPYLTTTLQQ